MFNRSLSNNGQNYKSDILSGGFLSDRTKSSDGLGVNDSIPLEAWSVEGPRDEVGGVITMRGVREEAGYILPTRLEFMYRWVWNSGFLLWI